ncbi:MAG: molybdate ABC transporter substrate-binding protein [Actinobacteria bacterium]|nr:molybdate ABC transporter substrate-binding protein [Actinomycetota bacterium]
MRKRLTALLFATIAAGATSACGSSSSGNGGSGGALVVSAASSLTDAFTAYGRAFDGGAVRFSFAGSDELAAQIGQGVKPDVFAAASPRFPEQLHAEGLVGRPVAFAGNRLVLAVPATGAKVASVADLAQPGATLAIGSAGVPIGSYTRDVLARLGARRAAAVLANVRSEEPDVKGIVGKLTQGAVDAGFVYVTDVDATNGKLKAIELPAALQPSVAYEVAVVNGTQHAAAARRFIAGLLRGKGAAELRAAGFAPPPGG